METKTWTFLDWGIGGLSVLKAFQKASPGLPFHYLSDSGFTPYGKLSAEELRSRIKGVIHHQTLITQTEGIVLACNAASTAFIGETSLFGVPLYNVIESTAQELRGSDFQRIGVIGGDRTVSSKIYSQLMPEKCVFERSAQPLSALIEKGLTEGDEIDTCLKSILEPFQDLNLDALILACTHYPAAQDSIQRRLPEVKLIDPAQILARSMKFANKMGVSRERFWTSGDPVQMKEAGQKAFQVKIHLEVS